MGLFKKIRTKKQKEAVNEKTVDKSEGLKELEHMLINAYLDRIIEDPSVLNKQVQFEKSPECEKEEELTEEQLDEIKQIKNELLEKLKNTKTDDTLAQTDSSDYTRSPR